VFLGGKQILEKRFLNYKTSVEDNMSFAITKDLMSIIKKKTGAYNALSGKRKNQPRFLGRGFLIIGHVHGPCPLSPATFDLFSLFFFFFNFN